MYLKQIRYAIPIFPFHFKLLFFVINWIYAVLLGEFITFTMQEDAISLDWENWIFSEGSFPSCRSDLGYGSINFERSVNSLQFDDFPSIFHPSTTLACQSTISLDQCPDDCNKVLYFSNISIYAYFFHRQEAAINM